MQKSLIFISIFVLKFFSIACSSQAQHLRKLKDAYPYGLIGDDYSILNGDDLALNTCYVTEAKPFSPLEHSPYPYWKCYFVKDTTVTCDDPEYDEDLKDLMVIMAFEVRKKNENQDYLSHRVIPLKSCQWFQKEFQRLTKGEDHFCISGQFQEKEGDLTTWFFDKFKTKKGCVSHDSGKCDLRFELSKGCNIKPMKK